MKLFVLASQTGAECDITDGETEIVAAAGLEEVEDYLSINSTHSRPACPLPHIKIYSKVDWPGPACHV